MTFEQLEGKIGKQDKKDWHPHKNGGGWIHKDAIVDEAAFVGENAIVWKFYQSRDTRVGADARLIEGVFRGGVFWGGEFRGGEFRGGEFRGGVFWGGVFRGGVFRGGVFWGGEFRGGEFRGGEFRGGVFWGGEFRGGEFRGGVFRGGVFRGGVFWGGEFRGGEFRGGEFRGGVFRGGVFEDEKLKWDKSPLFIQGSRHTLCDVKPGFIQIGCHLATLEQWESAEGVRIGQNEGYSSEQVAEYQSYIALFRARHDVMNKAIKA